MQEDVFYDEMRPQHVCLDVTMNLLKAFHHSKTIDLRPRVCHTNERVCY